MIIPDLLTPNRGPRPDRQAPRLVVLHHTDGTDNGDALWLTSPASKASYHYLIQRTGQVIRLVPEEERAWHAGKSGWHDVGNVNDFSIGVGLSHTRSELTYTDAQYVAAGQLMADILARWGMDFASVVGHNLVATPKGRKTDPEYFHWGRLFGEVAKHLYD